MTLKTVRTGRQRPLASTLSLVLILEAVALTGPGCRRRSPGPGDHIEAPPSEAAARRAAATLETAAVQSGRTFAFQLVAELRDQAEREGQSDPTHAKRNVLVSPFSVHLALSMLHAGSRGQSAAELSRLLSLPPPGPDLNALVKAGVGPLLRDGQGPGVTLSLANRFWFHSGLALVPAYPPLLKDVFGSGLETVDFAARPAQIREEINRWVSTQTQGRIQEILGPTMIRGDTRLVLANTVHFLGKWAVPFKTDSTGPDKPFHVTPTQVVKVPLMRQVQSFPYVDAADAQVLELPYQDGAFSFILWLPKAYDGLSAVEASLDPRRFERDVQQLAPRKVEVLLPRFEFGRRYDLTKMIGPMGLSAALRHDNFAGITTAKKVFNDPVLIHQTWIKVYEVGTEAAAATVSESRIGSARAEVRPPIVRFDRPFVLAIVHRPTATILFFGRVVNPAPELPLAESPAPRTSGVEDARPRLSGTAPLKLGQVTSVGVDPAEVRDVVRRGLWEIRACSPRTLPADGQPREDLWKVTGRIHGDGRITDVEVNGGSDWSAGIRPCAIAAVRRWRLPRPASGEATFSVQLVVEVTF